MANPSYCDRDALPNNVTRLSSEATEDPMYSVLVANIAFSAFLCYTTTVMNIVTIYALMKTSFPSKPLKVLLLSLAVSDLGVGFFGFPFQIAFLLAEARCRLSNGGATTVATKINNVVVSTFFMSSLSTILTISVDRFIAIEMPLRYEDIMTHKRTVAVITVIWLFSAASAILSYGFEVTLPKLDFVLLVFIELVSFVVTTMSSCKIYVTIKRHKKQMERQIQQVCPAENRVRIKLARHGSRKSTSGTLLLYLFFWVCYLPHFAISIVRVIYAGRNTIIEVLFTFSMTLVFLNSSINPIIFCWKMTPLRRTVLSILRNTFEKYVQGTESVAV